MNSRTLEMLTAVYDAVGGVASERGAETFDRFYKGGGEKMLSDFGKALEECGNASCNRRARVRRRGGTHAAKGRKTFLVDVFRTYACSVRVDARDEDEAHRLVETAELDGRLDPAGFSKTDDCDVEVYGEVENDGPNPWPVLEEK